LLPLFLKQFIMPRGHPRLRAETPALRRAGTNDEYDCQEQMTRMGNDWFPIRVIRCVGTTVVPTHSCDSFLFSNQNKENVLKEWVRPFQFLLTVGWYVALSLIIPVAIGYWLDRPGMLNKAPLFTFVGLGVGTILAFGGLIRMLLRYQAEQEELRKNKQN
jgi:hypothetical protein